VRATNAFAELCSCVEACPRCQGLGRVAVERDGILVTGRCRCQQLPDRIALFNYARIPARHAESTFGTFSRGALQKGDENTARAMTGVLRWKGDFFPHKAQGLVLHGPVGRGKTHLLVALLRDLIFEHGVAARYVEFSRLLGELKEGYDHGQGDSQLLSELADIPILAIDELGKGRVTDWELTVIDEIVNRRYNGMRCTLGATNYAPQPATGVREVNLATVDASRQTLGDRVGDRVFSRISQMCAFIEVGGPDMRPRMGN